MAGIHTLFCGSETNPVTGNMHRVLSTDIVSKFQSATSRQHASEMTKSKPKRRKGCKRKLTEEQKRQKKLNKELYEIIFINGKQKRVRRPPTIDGLPVDEFIARNADRVWLMQNGHYELLHEHDNEQDHHLQP